MYLIYLIFYNIIKAYPFPVHCCHSSAAISVVWYVFCDSRSQSRSPPYHRRPQGLFGASGCSLFLVGSLSVQEDREESPGWKQTRKRGQLANMWAKHLLLFLAQTSPLCPLCHWRGEGIILRIKRVKTLLTQKVLVFLMNTFLKSL